jgi:uncharacterized SAM-binding protein YcdF (DUF218 family)
MFLMPETSLPSRSRSLRSYLGVLAALALLGAVIFVAITGVGRWLVVSDPLKPARAVVVLSGGLPFRAMGAAKIYREGWAPEVWLTRPSLPEDAALSALGIEAPHESAYNIQVLEKLGVPSSAIRVLRDPVQNTASEEQAISKELKAVGGNRVIIVTSRPHTRRTKAIWQALVGDTPEVIVRGASEDAYDPAHWWRNTYDVEAVSHELLGLINVWCGFPARPDRR